MSRGFSVGATKDQPVFTLRMVAIHGSESASRGPEWDFKARDGDLELYFDPNEIFWHEIYCVWNRPYAKRPVRESAPTAMCLSKLFSNCPYIGDASL
jgi:hypothetical protein